MSRLIPSTTPLRKFKGHEDGVRVIAVFPDKRRMITSSDDKTVRLWDLKTGEVLKKMEGHSSEVGALAVSRDGQLIASGDFDGEVIAWHGETGELLTQPIQAHSSLISSLNSSPDGTVLATGSHDNTTKLWDTKTWQMLGDPIECSGDVRCIRYSPSGELLAIVTNGNIEIYNPGTRECVASFKGHTSFNTRLVWTPDGTRLLTGGDEDDPTIREWDTLTWQQVGDPWTGHTGLISAITVNPAGKLIASASTDNHVRLWRLSDRRTVAVLQHSSSLQCVTFSVDGGHLLSGGFDNMISEWVIPDNLNSKILAMTTARDACIDGDLSIAEELLTQEIDTDANNHASYAHRSFVMARTHNWDNALQDAIKSVTIQPSLTGYISKGIALCGKGHIRGARAAFDVAFMYTNQDPETIHFLLLIKAIALFNADQHEEAMLLVEELAAGCPNADTRACRIVEAYLHVQLGIKALEGTHHDKATDHFTTAVNSCTFSSKWPIHEIYEDLVVLFGWDLQSLWLTAHQKRCQAFLSAGKVDEALESHKSMMDFIDETTKASCLDWSNEFQKKCSALAAANDRILGAEVPGQDGYDAEPDFFRGMHGHSQMSRSRPQQSPGRLKRLRLAMTRRSHSAPPPPPVPSTTLSPATPPTTFKSQKRHLFTRAPDNVTPPVVEVPFAKGKLRNAAAGAPESDDDLIRDEDADPPPSPNPNTQQQSAAVQVDAGEHGGGRSCCCC